MDGLSGAASLIQVISLAIQLGDSVFKFSRALKSIRNASKELQVLARDLDRLRGILWEVARIAQEQQYQSIACPPSVNLYTALENCRMRFEALEAYATKVNASLRRKGMQKTLGALKILGRRETLRELQVELDRSIDHLGTLLILNSTKIKVLVIEAVFLLREEEITYENQLVLEADSERLGRNWCLTLEESGIDAEAHVQRMIGLNGGRDVYLESVSCRERGFAIRRLLRGTAREPALRWEWSFPPKTEGAILTSSDLCA
ncbi:MAG: hypothetical protein Q9208_001368 [Pyrenodesmia sp. 3 TL-2023]